MKKYWIFISTLCLCACGVKVSTDKEEVGWQKETSGVWTMSVGTPEKVNLLSELHITPKIGCAFVCWGRRTSGCVASR